MIIRRKKIFRKETNQFSSQCFFPFAEIAHDAQSSSLQSWCLVKYNVGCHSDSDAEGGGFDSCYRPYLLRSFRYSLTRYFLTTEIGVFGELFRVFWANRLFFSQFTSFPTLLKQLFFFSKFFEKARKILRFS